MTTENQFERPTPWEESVLSLIIIDEQSTIPELRDELGISNSGTDKAVSDLIKKGILIRQGRRDSTGGRPRNNFTLNEASVPELVEHYEQRIEQDLQRVERDLLVIRALKSRLKDK